MADILLELADDDTLELADSDTLLLETNGTPEISPFVMTTVNCAALAPVRTMADVEVVRKKKKRKR